MKRTLLLLLTVITFSVSSNAQDNSDRLSLGIGCLYKNGLDLTLSYEHIGNYHNAWEFLPMVTFNGTNVLHVDTYVRNHSGETIEVMGLVLPTNLVL